VITAFAAANGIGVPLTGWLMGRYGVGQDLVFSVLAFTAASFLLRHCLEPAVPDLSSAVCCRAGYPDR